jgi:O-antigen ligase
VTSGIPVAERFGACLTEVTTNLIGIIAVISIIFSIHNISRAKWRSQRIFFSSCLLPAFTVIFLAQTRSVLLALLFALIIVLFSWKKMLAGTLLLMGVILFVGPVGERFTRDMTENLRVKQGLLAWEVVKDYPVAGIGFGMQTFSENLELQNYNAKLPGRFQGQEILPNPHNMYADIAVRTGIPGIVFFFGVIFSFFRMLWRLRRNGTSDLISSWTTALFAAGLSFFTIGFFEPVFSHYPESVLCVIFAMGTILWRINEDSKTSVTA